MLIFTMLIRSFHWGLGEGVHVRDHSLREVICNKLREEAREEGQLLGERLKEPYEIKVLQSEFS